MVNQVVARYADGRTLKGTSLDVDHKRPLCHIRTEEGTMVEVRLLDLKALFFVRSLVGDSERNDAHHISPTDARLRGARLVEVTFKDGERITALTMRYPLPPALFFLTPVDTGGNNLRILVNGAEVKSAMLVKTDGR
jgi:hypothetical protein